MLNLPDVIYCKDNDKFLEFSYLADGTKLSMINYMDVGMIYVGPLVYFKIENDIVFGGAEFDGGRFFSTSYNGVPDIRFFVTDHLGSVRRVLDADLNLVEQNDYYPFGKRIDDPEKLTADNIYRYNGKESLEIFGIPYSDYGARLFDSNIGRWLQTDPLAQDYPNINPYVFCANNPMNVIDPNGMDIYRFDKTTGELFLHTETDDDFDQIGKFVYNKKSDTYELKTDKKGTAKILIDNIEKGILSDGLNLKTNSNIINVNGMDDSFISGFEKFIVQLSDMIGREISGYYFNNNESGRINEIYIGKYENNTYNESVKGTLAKNLPLGFFNNKSFQTDWHTHPSDAPDIVRLRPSSKDIESRNNTKNKYDIKEYVILTNGHRVCYTNW